MSTSVNVNSGSLIWLGEHWINAIRPEGAEQPSAIVSLFHTRYSSAGEGNAALVRIHGGDGFHAVCADSPELARFAIDQFFCRVDYFDEELPVVSARFAREGDVRQNPAWRIEMDEHRVLARWLVVDPPVIAQGSFRPGTEHFTALFFASEASIGLDGQLIDGAPYLRDIWKPSIGGDRSSCVFALAETFIQCSDDIRHPG